MGSCLNDVIILFNVLAEGKRRIRVRSDGDGVYAYRRTRLLLVYTVRIRLARLYDIDGSRQGLRGPGRRSFDPTLYANRKIHSFLGRRTEPVRNSLRSWEWIQRQIRCKFYKTVENYQENSL